jgi:hypothetical protein
VPSFQEAKKNKSLNPSNWFLPKPRTPRLMSTIPEVCLAAASSLSLNGCTAVKVKLGMKIYLAKTPVASMQASLPKGPAIAPGHKLSLVVQFTQPDGKVLLTEGQGQGKVLWSELTVTPSVVTADQKGHVTLPRDPRVSDGKVGHVTITVPTSWRSSRPGSESLPRPNESD